MYRFLLINLFTLILTTHSFTQPLHDAVWVLGIGGEGVTLDFSDDTNTPIIESIIKPFDMFVANTSISDESGLLQFYTNGCHILNSVHEIMENGDSLNPSVFPLWCRGVGSPFSQSVLALPWPGKPKQYALFHLSDYAPVINYDSLELSTGTFHQLSLTEIDMRLNQGLGAVVRKRQQVFWDTLAGGYLQAVRHVNGEDWWLLVPELRVGEGTNCYYRLRFTRYGIVESGKQCLGQKWDIFDAAGQCAFSPDGSRYVRFHAGSLGYFSGLFLFDFDRCTGLLSNHQKLYYPDSISFSGVSFSPNNRFLYANNGNKAYQYDVLQPDSGASRVLIAEYDNYEDSTSFSAAQLAPDGKIYISTTGPTYYLHLIHYPDSTGLACQFEQRGVELPDRNGASIPNFPHFRLGAASEPCYQAPELVLPRQGVCVGERFSLPLMGRYLDSIGRLEAALRWDPGLLRLDTAVLVAAELSGLAIDFQQVAIGQLGLSWEAAGGQSVSLSGYTNLLELAFEAIGAAGSSTEVQFFGQPIVGQYLNGQPEEVDAHIISSAVSITQPRLENVQVLHSNGGPNGSIYISIVEGLPPYRYQWSNGATDEDPQGVGAGEYFCTITDYAGCVLEIGPIEVDNTSSVEEVDAEAGWWIVPNPVENNVIYVDLPDLYSGYWQMRDLAGRLVQSGKFQQLKRFSIHTDLDNGLYLLHIQTADSRYHWNEKMIINR